MLSYHIGEGGEGTTKNFQKAKSEELVKSFVREFQKKKWQKSYGNYQHENGFIKLQTRLKRLEIDL